MRSCCYLIPCSCIPPEAEVVAYFHSKVKDLDYDTALDITRRELKMSKMDVLKALRNSIEERKRLEKLDE